MGATSNSLVLTEPGHLEFRTFAVPSVADDDGLLEVEAVAICATDLKMYQGKLDCPFPLILGHEILGHVVAAGEEFLRRQGLELGARVVVAGSVPCWSCRWCHTGQYKFCRRKRSYGSKTSCDVPPHLWGAFGQRMYLAPGSILRPISEEVPTRAAVLAHSVIANGCAWLDDIGGLRPGERVVVLGAGPQALGCAAFARFAGAGSVVMAGLESDGQRLALAEEAFGADATVFADAPGVVEELRERSGGDGVDLVVDVTGSPSAFRTGVEVLEPRGRLVLAGLAGDGVQGSLDLDRVVWKELSIRGAYTKGSRAIDQAVRLLEARQYPFERIVTDVRPLGEADEAFASLLDSSGVDRPIKIALDPAR